MYRNIQAMLSGLGIVSTTAVGVGDVDVTAIWHLDIPFTADPPIHRRWGFCIPQEQQMNPAATAGLVPMIGSRAEHRMLDAHDIQAFINHSSNPFELEDNTHYQVTRQDLMDLEFCLYNGEPAYDTVFLPRWRAGGAISTDASQETLIADLRASEATLRGQLADAHDALVRAAAEKAELAGGLRDISSYASASGVDPKGHLGGNPARAIRSIQAVLHRPGVADALK